MKYEDQEPPFWIAVLLIIFVVSVVAITSIITWQNEVFIEQKKFVDGWTEDDCSNINSLLNRTRLLGYGIENNSQSWDLWHTRYDKSLELKCGYKSPVIEP